MPSLPIDLTKMRNECVEPISMEESHGPSVHFEWDEPYNFPDEGLLTVKFRVKRREEHIRADKSKRFEEMIELLEIQKVKSLNEAPPPPASSRDEAGQAMDKLRAESGV